MRASCPSPSRARSCRMRTSGYGLPDRRRAGHQGCGDSVRRRRRHRVPDEAHRPRPASPRARDRSGPAGARDRARDALRDGRVVPDAPSARGHGRRLAGHGCDRADEGPRLGSARHERQRQSLRRVRRAHGARRARPDSRAGRYLALLSHSGSRGTGAHVADHYSKLARDLHPELPAELSHLAWLDLSIGGRAGILGRDGAHGPLCGREPRAHPRARGARARRRGAARCREPPQLRVARTPPARRWHRRRRHRAPQGRDARRRGRARHHPGFDGDAGLCRARERSARRRSTRRRMAPAGR